MERINREELLMEVAFLFAKRGSCGRAQVGCAFAIKGRVIATGYNGPLPNFDHCHADICDLSRGCEKSIHAEANAISFAAKEGIALQGSELYCTHLPCKNCASLLIQAGITKVYFYHSYRDEGGRELLINNRIPVIQLNYERKK